MCGLAGYCLLHSGSPQELESSAVRMAAAISQRGPDARGVWAYPPFRLALAHQRLAILDKGPAGHQPMHSSTGRYSIVFNGEIYNHLSIRRDLENERLAPPWHGHSDTETLLAAIEAWGLDGAMNRCSGMWAFAVVDRKQQRLHLARDRFGEKPLYWGITSAGERRAFVFASQLSALRAYPGFNNKINRNALSAFFRFGHVPAPLSILDGIWKLPAGHHISLNLPLDALDSTPKSQPWWTLSSLIDVGFQSAISSESEGLELLENSLNEVISEQAVADVPLGTFLSGGIDSSLVSALLQSQQTKPLRTFTIGFEDAAFNEAPYARGIASHLGTDHTETILCSKDVLGLIPKLPLIYDEPFADSSQLPTHLVCREAKRAGLTVALSGDGADELFGGYNRYLMGPRLWSLIKMIPNSLRAKLGTSLLSIPPSAWDVLSSPLKVTHFGVKAHKTAKLFAQSSNSRDFYNSLIHIWPDPAILIKGSDVCHHNTYNVTDQTLSVSLSDSLSGLMMAWDTLGYLPDDILVKVDRAAMSVGLETRSPFLDNRIASIAWRLPSSMKIRGRTSKWALRQILYKYVPRSLIERPKSGFAIPIGDLLRGPLKDWCSELIQPSRLEREGYLQPQLVNQIWHQHLSRRYDHTEKIWSILMWQSWLDHWG